MLILSFITCFASIANADQAPTLQLFYNFNKDTGKEILDASGNGLSGVVTGTKYVGGDKFGGAMLFDGKSHIRSPQEIKGFTDKKLKAITVEHWVFLEANTGETQQIWEALNSTGAWPAETFIEGTQEMTFYIYDDNKKAHEMKTPKLSLKKWHHIAGTYDGSVQRLYLDGKKVAEEKWSGTFTLVSAKSGAIVIGKDNEADQQYWGGLIDEFAVYTRALSETEIKRDMNRGIVAVSPAGKMSVAWGDIKSTY